MREQRKTHEAKHAGSYGAAKQKFHEAFALKASMRQNVVTNDIINVGKYEAAFSRLGSLRSSVSWISLEIESVYCSKLGLR